MQSISETITAFLRWLVTFSPWPVRIRTTHRAIAFQHRFRFQIVPRSFLQVMPLPVAKRFVRYVPCTKKRHSWCRTLTLGPGIHWYWPKTTEIEVLPVERQTLDLPVQILWTADLESVAVRGEVVFVIDDIRLAVCKTFDFQQTIQDVTQFVVVTVVASKTCAELEESMRCTRLNEELTDRLQAELTSYGVGVERAFFADFTKCSAIRVYGEPGQGFLPLDPLHER